MNDVSYKLQLKDSENNLLEANYYLSSTTQPELITGRYYRVIGGFVSVFFINLDTNCSKTFNPDQNTEIFP